MPSEDRFKVQIGFTSMCNSLFKFRSSHLNYLWLLVCDLNPFYSSFVGSAKGFSYGWMISTSRFALYTFHWGWKILFALILHFPLFYKHDLERYFLENKDHICYLSFYWIKYLLVCSCWFKQVIKENIERTLKNTNIKPLSHSSYLRLQFLCKSFYDVDDKLRLLGEVSLADLKAFIPKLRSQVKLSLQVLCDL